MLLIVFKDIKTTNIKKKSHESKSKIVKNIENLNSVKGKFKQFKQQTEQLCQPLKN